MKINIKEHRYLLYLGVCPYINQPSGDICVCVCCVWFLFNDVVLSII